MAFLSVSGLGSGGEDDALSRLLSGRQAPGVGSSSSSSPVSANARGLEEALRKTQAEVVFDHGAPAAKQSDGTPDTQAPPLPADKKQHVAQKAPVKSAISNRDEPLSTSTDSRQTAPPVERIPLAPSEQGKSGFRADNPENTDDLPAIAELVHQKLVRPLQETMGIDQLTRIQKLSWSAMVSRDVDVIVRSETGSGKTLAYALPVMHAFLQRCDAEPIAREYGTAIIVMCPTRELVLQVSATMTTLLRCAQFITVGGVHGGDNRHKEKARLRKGLTVLVTTPGRLLDHLKTTSAFKLDNMQTIIMDEADRLLDMGFERPVREIMDILLSKCKQPQQLKRALVSATVTDAVERLSHFALRSRVVRVGETEDTYTIPSTLRQHCMSVPVKHRLAVLLTFLRSQLDAGATKIVVFTSTADSAEFLYYLTSRLESPFLPRRQHGKIESRPKSSGQSTKKLVERANRHLNGESDEVVTFDDDDDGDNDSESGEDEPAAGGRGVGHRLASEARRSFVDANVFKLHGNMTQVDRSSVFRAFKTSSGGPSDKSVLFCTDVAARGLDMPRIDWIVHYDPPAEPTSYIHRVGRTARIGNSGDSILFLAPYEMGYAQYLTNFIHSQGQSEEAQHKDMTQRKYESFLFYLTKLDPRSHHMWVQSTATLERGIAQLVMQKKEHMEYTADQDDGDNAKPGRGANDDLGRIAMFAYQSYIRAYAGMPKAVKALFFDQSNLHLGHVANSFGISRSPTELQRQLRSTIREDHTLSRDNRKGTTSRDAMEAKGMKRQRIEIEHDSRYHSMLAQKQRKTTRDWAEKRREESTRIKPHQFSEFDA